MRSIDEIMADMQEIMSQATLTQEDVNTYLALEAELAAAQQATAPAPAEGEPAPEPTTAGATAPAPATARAAAPVAAANALRARHAAYTRVIVPAGRPSNGVRTQAETENDGFRAYLRTGQPNADLVQGSHGYYAPSNAQTTGTGSSGGDTVPQDFQNRMIEVLKSFGGLLNEVETLNTEDGRPIPGFPTIDDTGSSAVIAAENTAPASAGADLVFGTVDLGAFEYNATGTGNTPLALPRSLVQDSAVDIEGLVARMLGTRLRRKMATDAVNGSGSGEPQGLLDGITGQEVVTASVLAYSDLTTLVMSVDAAYWENAKLYCNQASLGVISGIEDTNGNLIFRQTVTILDGQPKVYAALAIGPIVVPVVLDNAFPAMNLTAGQGINWGAFGDVREGYIWRQVRDVEVLVDPYSANDKRQIKYNAWVRADGKQKNTAAYKVIAGHTT